jgi:hypothetical protein
MKFANVYDKGRKHWWIYYWCPVKRKRVYTPTPYLKSDPTGRKKALDLAREKAKDAAAHKPLTNKESWELWVPQFLERTYAYNPKTLTRYQNAWSALYEFLHAEKIPSPRHLLYRHAHEYLGWRVTQKRACGKPINHNTAVTELKILSRIMREAHRLGYCDSNPFYQLGLKRINVREKPEITDYELDVIREALKSRPDWMRISFEIALHQGCRLSETSVPLDFIDLARGTISFRAKGRNGSPNVFATALHPHLRPLIDELKKQKATHTCILPKMAAKEWHFFFKEVGLPHLSFHSTRVTVVTKMARAGINQQQAMRYVGHASETVHRVYQRLTALDVAGVTQAVQYAKRETPGIPDDPQSTSPAGASS